MSSVDFFRENKYVVIKNLISKDFIDVYYEYCKLQTQAIDWKSMHRNNIYNKYWDGRFDNDYSFFIYR